MPLYEYDCKCGRFERVAGYEDYTIACPHCGGTAERIPVYSSQGVIFKGAGFTKSVLPPRPQSVADHQEVNELYGKEVAKRGWTADRAVGELRASRFTDDEDQLRIDTRKMTKEA